MSEIMVSVICTAYNHEKYIRDALEGFVLQKTNFKFEVLINDDASTDNTASIIREYEKKYPELIKPIYQTENQYSKGIKISTDILIPKSKGKYLAFCEGDDFWCDCNKLQKQIDILEKHPEYSACVHNTRFLYVENNSTKIGYPEKDMLLGLKDCVMSGAQSYQTSSLVVRKEITINRPAFTFMIRGVGDYPCSIYYSMCGPIYYLGTAMSTYRIGTEYSWTKNVAGNKEKHTESLKSIVTMLHEADKYYKYKYHNDFLRAIDKTNYRIQVINREYKKAVKNPTFKCVRKREKCIILLYAYIPFLRKFVDIVRKIGK